MKEKEFEKAFKTEIKAKKGVSNPTRRYIDEEISPIGNILEFMYKYNFISECCYERCRQFLEETVKEEKSAIEKRIEEEAKYNIAESEKRMEERKEYIQNFIQNHKIGDKVLIKGTLIGTKLPRYLEGGGCLTIEGFTSRGNVKCRWDAETVFSISPCYLKDI